MTDHKEIDQDGKRIAKATIDAWMKKCSNPSTLLVAASYLSAMLLSFIEGTEEEKEEVKDEFFDATANLALDFDEYWKRKKRP